MEPIIFNRADVRELAREMIKCGGCTGVNVTGHIVANWAHFGPAVLYVNSRIDAPMICPSRIAHPAGDYVNSRKSYLQRITDNAIAAIMHEMCENCSVKPVLYSQYDNFELREMEECSAAFQYIQNGDFEFVRDRAYELGIDACHLSIDGENQLIATINGTDAYRVKFRVYFGDLSIGEIE
jgi:hypothetical protein